MFTIKPHLKEQLKTLPEKPGVYLMKDKYGRIIYVGKSKRLKDRVSSYFRGFNTHMPKVQTMVVNIEEFEYIITDSEEEALQLEANLIKKHKPKFNVMLKDDKSYPYIMVTLQDKYPRLVKVRQVKKDGARYFGPYSSNFAVNQVIEALHDIYPIRKCNRNLETIKRPCLNYHIKKCIGPCIGDEKYEEYQQMIGEILQFLQGNHGDLLKELTGQMQAAAEKRNFEWAMILRDRIKAIEMLGVKQKINRSDGKDQDLIVQYSTQDLICVTMFVVRGGRIIDRENYPMNNALGLSNDEIITSFIGQYYSEANFIPEEILLEEPLQDEELLRDFLSKKKGKKVVLTSPKIGEKKRLVQMVKTNAKEYIEKFEEKIHRDKAWYEDLKLILETITYTDNIHRIEAYDISNIYGVLSVGSMVVFEDGKKKKSDYRRFKIKQVTGPDDYASLREVIRRRLTRRNDEEADLSFKKLPDLLLIDGGKGQVSSVMDVVHELGFQIPVAGMVKDEKHRTRGLYFDGQVSEISTRSDLYRFLYSIQEEVHRFAIDYHRKLRSKQLTTSILDEIPGVGPKRRNALLQHFGQLEKIRKASLEALEEVPGMDKKTAQTVFAYFTNEEQKTTVLEEEQGYE